MREHKQGTLQPSKLSPKLPFFSQVFVLEVEKETNSEAKSLLSLYFKDMTCEFVDVHHSQDMWSEEYVKYSS